MLDDLNMIAPRSQTELRSLLGSFLFSADDVFKKIGVLSGGERNRYALARMLLHPSNFLLLDEPTNHLDLRAKDVLLESLQKFSGTCVFVSHDRYFIDRLATRVFEVADGAVNIYPGNYEDYLWRKQNGAQALEESLRASMSRPRRRRRRGVAERCRAGCRTGLRTEAARESDEAQADGRAVGEGGGRGEPAPRP